MKGINLKTLPISQIKGLAVLVLSVVVAAVLIFLLVIPWIKEIISVQGSINQAQGRITALAQKESVLSKADSDTISQTLGDLITALPNDKDVPSLLVGVSRLSSDAGLSIEALQISPGQVSTASAKAKNESVDFEVTLKGSAEALISFLKNLESARRLLVVKDISATMIGQASSLTTTLKISAPYQGFAPPPDDISNPVPTLTAGDEKVIALINKFTNYTGPVPSGAVGKQNPFQ